MKSPEKIFGSNMAKKFLDSLCNFLRDSIVMVYISQYPNNLQRERCRSTLQYPNLFIGFVLILS